MNGQSLLLSEEEWTTWSRLHQRFAQGNALTAEERQTYDSIRARLDAEEQHQFLTTFLPQAAALREKVALLEVEVASLRAKAAERSARIRELEAILEPPLRQALGIVIEPLSAR